MASHKSVIHVQRGFRMAKGYAEQVMRDHCSIAWVVPGETIRDTTDEERIALRADQAQQVKRQEQLARKEINGLKFERPRTTKYRAPYEAYDDFEDPSVTRVCRWPRRDLAA